MRTHTPLMPTLLALAAGCGLSFDDWPVSSMPTVATPCALPALPRIADPSSDRDGDCLDDATEQTLARWFSPWFIFDSRENARRPDEPVMVYQATRPRGCEGDEIEITYGYLFADDGGFVASGTCSDNHPGDNQYLRLTLHYDEDAHGAALTSLWAWGFTWPRYEMHFAEGHHPVIFLSGGKHHPYFDTRADGQGSPYSAWGCREAMDGRGPRIESSVDVSGSALGWTNVGERNAHPPEQFVNGLDPLGFSGESAWSTEPFCGGRPRQGCSTSVNSMQALWR